MWIESHVDIAQHPKLYQLCQKLKIRKPEAIGVLHLLWHFTMKFSWRDGDLRRFTPSSLCMAIDWRGNPDQLFTALRESGWIDGEMQIHDWMDYAGKVVKDRLYNELRRKTSLNDVNPRKSTATNPTLPTNQPKTFTSSGDDARALPPSAEGEGTAPTVEKLVACWNTIAHVNLPRVKLVTPARKRIVKAALVEHPEKEFWLTLFERVNRSRFLRGENGDNGHGKWCAGFDWVLKPANMTKILEGNYDDTKK